MNEETTLGSSQTNWEALEELKDEDIDLSEIPEVTAEQIARSSLRVGVSLFQDARCGSISIWTLK